MSRAHAVSATVNSPADAVLHALPHPVIMVSPDGKIADANVAADSVSAGSQQMSSASFNLNWLKNAADQGNFVAGSTYATPQAGTAPYVRFCFP